MRITRCGCMRLPSKWNLYKSNRYFMHSPASSGRIKGTKAASICSHEPPLAQFGCSALENPLEVSYFDALVHVSPSFVDYVNKCLLSRPRQRLDKRPSTRCSQALQRLADFCAGAAPPVGENENKKNLIILCSINARGNHETSIRCSRSFGSLSCSFRTHSHFSLHRNGIRFNSNVSRLRLFDCIINAKRRHTPT